MKTNVEKKIEAMLDEHEIRKVLTLYTRGVDRLDADLVSSVYHPASTDDHGAYKGPGPAFGPYVVKALGEHTSATAHTLNQSIITVEGEKAHAETYFVAYHTRQEDDGEYIDRFGGRYIDKLTKFFGQWKIMDRVVVRDWSSTDKIDGSYYDPAQFEAGKRSKDDLAYGKP